MTQEPAPPPRLRIKAMRSDLAGPFDLEVEAGQAVAIGGASGAGKSLFLRMIADLDPNDGQVFIDDQNRADMPATAWRRGAPYVAAEAGWWTERVADHFAKGDRPAARSLAQALNLEPALFDGNVARLSTGERQRLALVRALVLPSSVLLLDEPTGPLDPESVERVEAVLKARAAAGAALILVTHDPRQAERLCARRYLMVNRRLEGPL